MDDYELLRIFPTTLIRLSLGRDFTQQETEAFGSFDQFFPNAFNRTSINTTVLEEPRLSNIKKLCEDALNTYLKEIIKSTDDCQLYVTQSWLNITSKGGQHHQHFHQNSILSGVFYVNANESHDRIYFHRPNYGNFFGFSANDFTYDNSTGWSFSVKTGDLIIFPSSLEHHVEPHIGDYDRISLAFNSFLKGTIGRSENLNLLKLGEKKDG